MQKPCLRLKQCDITTISQPNNIHTQILGDIILHIEAHAWIHAV